MKRNFIFPVIILGIFIFVSYSLWSYDDRQERYSELFDSQITTLKDRGCPVYVLDDLVLQKDRVLRVALNISIRRGNIPFLPIIPDSVYGIFNQMQMVKSESGMVHVALDVSNIRNIDKIPDKPYYIFDVNDGWDNVGMCPDQAEYMIRHNMIKRSPFFTEEIISLCTHTNVLDRHNVDALNSRVDENSVPSIVVKKSGPSLDWCFLKALSPKCGVPYCRRGKY